MKLHLNAKKVDLPEQIQAYIKQRAVYAFSRTQHIVSTVHVTVTDINGPRGGKDKQCKIVVRTDNFPDIVIAETQAELLPCINRALARSNQNLLQRLKRKRLRKQSHITQFHKQQYDKASTELERVH